jgi:uncharacterized protein GlcG (DUF336 family)
MNGMFSNRGAARALLISLALIVSVGCGGGGSGGGGGTGSPGVDFGCDGGCGHQSLSVDDVTRIVQQAVTAASSLGTAGTVAVVDRVGNVLAVYRMQGAPGATVINGQRGAGGGLEGASVASTLAAISKAGTGAYLSSQGNAFSTRTASQIIQEHFLPGQQGQPGGPLFGVQFSQLPCSDVTIEGQGSAGPHPLPLGLSGDPGGFPLYKSGDLVGGVGVEFDGVYSIDPDAGDNDDDPEERVALAATVGFEAPSSRVADTVSLAGRSARYSDLSYGQLEQSSVEGALESGDFVSVSGYSSAGVRPGVPFGTWASGIADTTRAGVAVSVLAGRFGTRAGRSLPGGGQLSGGEVEALLDSAIVTASRTRAAIRNPQDSAARVSVFVVDDQGTPLGFVRSQDAPVFGVDVALQKARVAALASSPDAAATLAGAGLAGYAAALSNVIGRPLDGGVAITSRAIGNLARPFLPDGIQSAGNGPLSKPYAGEWSVFNTGLQLDMILGAVVASATSPGSRPGSCAGGALGNRARNGIQIFAGGVPLYRDGILVGAIGVSGDGIDQDDMIAFYGASRRGLDYAGHAGIGDATLGFNAPPDMRIDALDLLQSQLRIRYVQCPEGPFVRDNEQNVCGDG